jgi:hypothetical protein
MIMEDSKFPWIYPFLVMIFLIILIVLAMFANTHNYTATLTSYETGEVIIIEDIKDYRVHDLTFFARTKDGTEIYYSLIDYAIIVEDHP